MRPSCLKVSRSLGDTKLGWLKLGWAKPLQGAQVPGDIHPTSPVGPPPPGPPGLPAGQPLTRSELNSQLTRYCRPRGNQVILGSPVPGGHAALGSGHCCWNAASSPEVQHADPRQRSQVVSPRCLCVPRMCPIDPQLGGLQGPGTLASQPPGRPRAHLDSESEYGITLNDHTPAERALPSTWSWRPTATTCCLSWASADP